MTIAPDDKDWTWVLRTPCPECRFDASTVEPQHVARRIREMLPMWRAVLARSDVAVRRDPTRWSDLEYGCHVRDVFRLYDQRLRLMLTEDDPLFANWDQDRSAIDDRYNAQNAATVAGELVDAGRGLSERFESVTEDQWSRPGRRSDGASFTVDTFAVYLLHDPVHHLKDVGAA